MPAAHTTTTTTVTTDDGSVLHLAIHNAPSPTRPSLVLLHYWGGSPSTWSPLLALPSLSPTHAVTYHARGWAPSTGPASADDGPHAYGTAAMSSDLAAVVRAARLDDAEATPAGYVVVGHSMGAKVAQHYAAGASERSNLRGLVLVAPAPLWGLRLPGEAKERQREAYESAEGARFVVENVLTARPGAVGEEVRERCVRDSLRGSEWARRAWPEYGAEEDFGGLVGGIGVPVLVLRGDRDFERDVVGELGVERGWVNVTVEDCGHLIPLEKPEELGVRIVEFLEGLD